MPRIVRTRLKWSDVFKRREGQLYAVFSRHLAPFLYPGATVDLSVEQGVLIIRGLRGPDRPKKNSKLATAKRRRR